MNPFQPALRELARIYDRQINRGSLWLAQRKLAAAETNLGLLGWQQADFEGDAQRHVEQLTRVEREQGRQTNESAALGLSIRQAQEKRDAGKMQYEEQRAVLELAWKEAAEPVETAERHLAARRKKDVNFNGLVADLEREQADLEAAQADLLGVPKLTGEMRVEVGRLRERLQVIPTAIIDLHERKEYAINDVQALEEKLAKARPRLAQATADLHAFDEQFARSDGTLERQITARTREKQVLEQKIEELEKAKNSPYRQIGQILADHEIAPLNQPQALAAVQQRRAVIVGLARAISRSHGLSATEDQAALRRSWLVCGGVIALLVAMGWFVAAR